MSPLALSRSPGASLRLRRPSDDTVVVFVALACTLLLFGSRMLGDPDTHWHVAVGRRMLEQGRVPWTDPYSHTFAGAPWIAKEWLSQIVFALVERAGGARGLVGLTVAIVAATFAWQYAWLRARLRPTLALALMLVAVALAMSHFLARPHVLVFPILLGWVIALTGTTAPGAGTTSRGLPPWRLVPVMVLWANLHGSFTIGFVLAALFGLEALVRAPRSAWPALAGAWGLFGVALLLASCISPYGYHSAFITLMVVESGEAFRFTTEWQPLRPDAEGAMALGALLLALAVLLPGWRRNVARILVAALVGYMMLRHARFTSLFAIVAPILTAPSLARFLPPLPATRRFGPVALAFLAALPMAVLTMTQPQPGPAVTPEAALAAARRAGLTGPVYNDHDFGGYLIAQGVPTFVDGRTDQLFLGGFLDGLREALGRPDHGPFVALLDGRGVTWAIVPPASPAARHLDALSGWTRIHADPTALVYRRA